MKNLTGSVRNKAIEIANALLDEKHMDEGIAIATAISRAKDWAVNHGRSIKNKTGNKTADVKEHGKDRYVVPHGDAWAVKVEGSKTVKKVFAEKPAAVSQARREAKKSNASLTIQKKSGRLQKRVSYNPSRKAAKRSK